jgi:peptidyl-prolyl cis-trans isomerase C
MGKELKNQLKSKIIALYNKFINKNSPNTNNAIIKSAKVSSITVSVKQKSLLKSLNSNWQNFVQKLFRKVGINLTGMNVNIITVVILLSTVGYSIIENDETLLATVNGIPIDAKEFYEELDKILDINDSGYFLNDESLEILKENILKILVENEMIRQEMVKAGISVKKAEIDTRNERFETESLSETYFDLKLLSPTFRKRIIEQQLMLEKLIESRGENLVNDIHGTEFYENNKRLWTSNEKVRASHILIKLGDNATPMQTNTAMKKIMVIIAKYNKGTKFEELAKKHSEAPNSQMGGDLGFFGLGEMAKPFEEAVFNMNVGEISSEPVKTRFGLHIIKVTDKVEKQTKSYNEVKDEIFQTLRNLKKQNLINKFYETVNIVCYNHC